MILLCPDNAFLPRRENTSVPTTLFCHVGRTPLSRHRFYAMSEEHLCPDIVFTPCRKNTSVPTSFLRHVGKTPLSRHRFSAMSGEHLCPDIVFLPRRENTSIPTTLFCHVGKTPLHEKRPGSRSFSTSFNIFIQHLLRYRTGLPFLLFFLLLPAARLRSYTC